MKLTAEIYPYSSVTGGGLFLLTPRGLIPFQLGLRGTAQGISKDQSDVICKQISELINASGGLDI